MPQMMPMFWTIMLMLILIVFMLVLPCLYFLFNPSLNKNLMTKKEKNNWMWKW